MNSLAARSLPRWMDTFLHTNFFGSLCTARSANKCSAPVKQCNMFCTDFIDGPLCKDCTDQYQHKGHHHLQARKSSNHAGINVEDIDQFVDTKGIKVYRINKADIYFLRSRQPQKKLQSPIGHGCCRTCNWRLDDGSLYCSIDCKLIIESGQQPSNSPRPFSEELEQHRKRSRPHDSTYSSDIPEPKRVNFRTRSRKGIPRRAPFF